ncbi:MAG: hypothetical protein R3B40_14245 [Polyangiales bacterium]|nr:hypothetical protein [Myxococcales bacterium]MCB9659215.1 hypothetical protein [Sandaracinaceae bacterium]
MQAQKLQVKFFARDEISDVALVPVFHEWIKRRVVSDELLIDVADYSHVPDGPGVMIIGHHANYAVDRDDARQGFTYSRKRLAEGDFAARVTDTFRRALSSCARLEAQEGLAARFGTGEVLFRIQDRLLAPNSEETVAAVKPALEATLAKLYPGQQATIESVGEAREPLTLRITVDSDATAADLLARLDA